MALGQGLAGLMVKQAANDEARAAATTGYNDVLLRKSGSQVKFRFLSDSEDIVFADFHTVWIRTQRGKSRPLFSICSAEADGVCALCESDDEAVSKTKTNAIAWVWTYEYLHPQKPQRGTVEARVIAGHTVFVEKIGKPMIIRIGYYAQQQLIEFASEYGTLCDRDYKMKRTGEDSTTRYLLVAADPSKPSFKMEEDVPGLVTFLEEETAKSLALITGKPVSDDEDTVSTETEGDYDF